MLTLIFFLKGKVIVYEIKKKTRKIFNVRFFNKQFTLKIVFLFRGNYQNISFIILSRPGKTNKFSHFLKSIMSRLIIKIKIKKLHGDYKYLSLILRTWVLTGTLVKC